MAARLATSGSLTKLLQQARALRASGNRSAVSCTSWRPGSMPCCLRRWAEQDLSCSLLLPLVQAASLADVLHGAVETIEAAAAQAVHAGQPNQPALQAALARLDTIATKLWFDGELPLPLALKAADDALDPVAQLAAHLLASMEQQQGPAERQLAAAQAAATRSCAYLRCANVGGSGGPAAGEGVGSKKCRCGRGIRVEQLKPCYLKPARSAHPLHNEEC